MKGMPNVTLTSYINKTVLLSECCKLQTDAMLTGCNLRICTSVKYAFHQQTGSSYTISQFYSTKCLQLDSLSMANIQLPKCNRYMMNEIVAFI